MTVVGKSPSDSTTVGEILRHRSLRRSSRRELNRLRLPRTGTRVRFRVPEWFPVLGARTSPLALPGTIFALAVAGLFLPGPGWIPALRDSDAATTFLGSLWQVVAGVAGLTITVVFFVLQSLSAARGSALRDSGLTGRFQGAIYLSVVSLIVIGLDLLHVGHAAPAGWSAAWASVISMLAVLSIAGLVAGLSTVMSPSYLQKRRLKMIHRQAQDYVDEEAASIVASNLLDNAQGEIGFERSLFRPSGTLAIATAQRSGVVTDIHMGQLQKLVVRGHALGLPPIRVATYLGDHVQREQGLILSDSTDEELLRIAEHVVRVSKAPTRQRVQNLDGLTEELHAEAIQAIRDARLAEFEMLAEAQRELLLALPRAWEERFGRKFTSDGDFRFFPLRVGPVSRVSRNMYEQMRASLGVDVRELALSVAFEPVHVATVATRLGATGLAAEMLRIAGTIVRIPVTNEISKLVRLHAWTNFHQVVQGTIEPIVEDHNLDEETRREAATLDAVSLDVMAAIAREAIITRDATQFAEIDRALGAVHEHWLEHHANTYPPRPHTILADEARRSRDRHRMAVAIWLIRELRRNPTDSKLTEMFRKLRIRGSGLAKLIQDDLFNSGDIIADWIMDEMPTGEMHSIDSLSPSLSGIAFLLADAAWDAHIALIPGRWLLDHRDALLAALEEVKASGSGGPLHLPPGSIERAVDEAKAALQTAADTQAAADDEILIAAEVTDGQGQHFQEVAAASWLAGDQMRKCLIATGMSIVTSVGPPPEPILRVPRDLASKSWIADRRGEAGLEMKARDLGRRLALGEAEQMKEALGFNEDGEAPYALDQDQDPNHVVDELRSAVGELRALGHTPTLILHGWSPGIWDALDVTPLTAEQREILPDGIRGLWEGVPIAGPGTFGDSQIAVLDSAAWAEVHEWVSDGSVVTTRLSTFGATSGTEFLEANPEVFSDLSSLADRLLELQHRVLVEGSAATQFHVKDPTAVRVLTL
jgi:hypothetical protein